MATVTLNLTLQPTDFPSGTALGNISATLTGTQPNNTYAASGAAGAVSIEIDNVAADTYAISVQQLDANGAALGSAVTGSVVVNPSTVSLQVPVSLSAVVS